MASDTTSTLGRNETELLPKDSVDSPVEKIQISPQEGKQILKVLSAFGVDINSFSPQAVFDLCTQAENYPLLLHFSQLPTQEEQANFLQTNPSLNELLAQLQGILETYKKNQEAQKLKEWEAGRIEYYQDFLPNMPEPFFGVQNGVEFTEKMIEGLLVWEKKYACDIFFRDSSACLIKNEEKVKFWG